MVKTIEIHASTNGNCDIVDITGKVAAAVSESIITDGVNGRIHLNISTQLRKLL